MGWAVLTPPGVTEIRLKFRNHALVSSCPYTAIEKICNKIKKAILMDTIQTRKYVTFQNNNNSKRNGNINRYAL